MISTFELWNILAGRASITQPDAIGEELDRNSQILTEGLQFYKQQCSASGNRLKSSQDVKRKEFLLRMSQFLNLDQWQTHELFQNYLRMEFRGSGSQLLAIIKHEGQLEGFLIKLMEFYFNERLYLLKCIKYLLMYWQVGTCLYQEQFAKVVDQIVNENVIEKFIDEMDEKFKQLPNHAGITNNAAAQIAFAKQFIKEQNELCDIIFLYYNDFEMPVRIFKRLSNLFRARHFGKSQMTRKFMDKQSEDLTERFGFISSLILLEGLDLELLRKFMHSNKIDITKHPIMKENRWKDIDKLLYSWDDVVQQGPVLMGWAICRHFCLPVNEQELTSFFGDSSMKCLLVDYLLSLLSSGFFQKDPLSGLMRTVVYTLVGLMLKLFQLETLSTPEIMADIVQKLLEEENLAILLLTEDINGGISCLIKSTQNMFPMSEIRYLRLLGSMCVDTHTSSVVYDLLEQQTVFTELFAKNKENQIKSMESNIWKRVSEKVLIGHINDGLVLPAEAEGKIFNHKKELSVVSWSYEYSGWVYLLLELGFIVENIMTYTNDSGEDGISIASALFDLITSILHHDPLKINNLQPFIMLTSEFLKRCFEFESIPLTLVESSLKCLCVVAKEFPVQIWKQLSFMQFLPTCDPCHANSTILESGKLAFILKNVDEPTKMFRVLKQYLNFIYTFLQSIDYDNIDVNLKNMQDDIIINIVFILRDIFTNTAYLYFSNVDEKTEISCCCLEIFSFVLSPLLFNKSKGQNCSSLFLSLKKVVMESLLSHGGCESLLSIITIGVDHLHALSSTLNSQNVIKLVKLSLSILDSLLNLKGKDNENLMSPLETNLAQQFVEQPVDFNFSEATCKETAFLVISKYVYHKTDPKLSILAILVLRSIAKKFPMCLTSSLGDSLHGLCNAFVNTLISVTKPIRLKIIIIEFLTTCIETQPGIIESITRLSFSKDTAEYSAGKSSCLNPIFNILEDKDNLDVLTVTALQFVAELWSNRCDIAMAVLKKKPGFWNAICHLLKKPVNIEKDSKILIDMTRYILEIILVEVYYVKENQLADELNTFIESFSYQETYSKIIELLKPHKDYDLLTNQKDLLKRWSNFLSVMTKAGHGGFNEQTIVMDVFDASVQVLRDWLVYHKDNPLCKDILIEMSDILLFMCHKWRQFLWDSIKVLPLLNTILHEVIFADDAETDHLMLSLYTVALVYLNVNGISGDVPQEELLDLSNIVCNNLLQQLKGMSTDAGLAIKRKIVILSLNLLGNIKTLVKSPSLSSSFVQVLKEHSTVINLIDTVERSIKKQSNLEFLKTCMLVFSMFAQNEEIARHMVTSRINSLLCLSLENLYKWKNQIEIEELWSVIFSVSAHLLKTLGYSYVEYSIDFIGAHHKLIIKSTNVIEQLAKGEKLMLTEKISQFLYEVSSYESELMFAVQSIFETMKESVARMVGLSTALLSRQRVLSHILECGNEESIGRLLRRTHTPSPTSFRSDSIKSAPVESTSSSSPKFNLVQKRLINILLAGVSTLRKLTPNVAQAILDKGMDINSFCPLVSLNFSSPSLDTGNDAPSFGMLISTLNVSLKLIRKISQCESDRTTPEKDFSYAAEGNDDTQQRSQLWFLIDGVLTLLMSQATCFLRHSMIDEREKQFLKRELGSDLSNFVYAVQRLRYRRGIPASPLSNDRMSLANTYQRSPSKLSICFSEEDENSLLKVANLYTKTLLK